MSFPTITNIDELIDAINEYFASPRRPSLKGEEANFILIKLLTLVTEYTDDQINALKGGAPEAYDTLIEIATQLAANDNEIGDLLDLINSKADASALDDKVDKVAGYGLSENNYTDADKALVDTVSGKQDALSFDEEPQSGSSNSVKSGGIYAHMHNNFVNFAGSYADPAWLTSLAWSKLAGKPNTISGYGITDFNSLGDARWEPLHTGGSDTQYWRGDKTWQTLNTSAVPEGANLYYTAARFNAAFAAKTTSDLPEGTNKYYTDSRVQTYGDTRWEQILNAGTGLQYYAGDKTWKTLLDGTGKIVSSLLPSYVDDVVEAANSGALPATGEAGKIYITLDNNKVYRWTGSIYVEIVSSPGSTDAVPEGSTNKYYTDARVAAYGDTRYLQLTGFTASAINALYGYTPANGANYLSKGAGSADPLTGPLYIENQLANYIFLKNTGGTPQSWMVGQDATGTFDGTFYVYDATTATFGLQIAKNKNATFYGDIGVGGTALTGGGAAKWITLNGTVSGGGLISSLSGVLKGYTGHYNPSETSIAIESVSGVDIVLQPNGTTRLKANSSGIEVTGVGSFTNSVVVRKDGSNVANEGFALINAAGSRYFNWQLDASGNLNGYGYTGSSFYKWLSVDYISGNSEFSGSVKSVNSFYVQKNGSNVANDGFALYNAAGNRYFNWQLDASGNLNGYGYNGSSFYKWLSVDYTNGSATFINSITATNYNGPGTGLTGTAPSLSIGGSASQWNGYNFTFTNGAVSSYVMSWNGSSFGLSGKTELQNFIDANTGGNANTIAKRNSNGDLYAASFITDAASNAGYMYWGSSKANYIYYDGSVFNINRGISVTGNGVFSGTLSASGYNNTNWDAAYSWGNHASAGYFLASNFNSYGDARWAPLSTTASYSEGTWTPTISTGTATAPSGRYTKIGNMVYAYFSFIASTSFSGDDFEITNLPFSVSSNSSAQVVIGYQTLGSNFINGSASSTWNTVNFTVGTTRLTNADFSGAGMSGMIIYSTTN